MAEAEYWRFTVARDCQKNTSYIRKSLRIQPDPAIVRPRPPGADGDGAGRATVAAPTGRLSLAAGEAGIRASPERAVPKRYDPELEAGDSTHLVDDASWRCIYASQGGTVFPTDQRHCTTQRSEAAQRAKSSWGSEDQGLKNRGSPKPVSSRESNSKVPAHPPHNCDCR